VFFHLGREEIKRSKREEIMSWCVTKNLVLNIRHLGNPSKEMDVKLDNLQAGTEWLRRLRVWGGSKKEGKIDHYVPTSHGKPFLLQFGGWEKGGIPYRGGKVTTVGEGGKRRTSAKDCEDCLKN